MVTKGKIYLKEEQTELLEENRPIQHQHRASHQSAAEQKDKKLKLGRQ
jgi:hypothetical protein